jgi:hypothetical protein
MMEGGNGKMWSRNLYRINHMENLGVDAKENNY